MRERVSAVVADDHPALRSAVADALGEHGIDVVGTAADGEEALAKIETRRPTVAVVDIRMPRLDGIELARRAAKSARDTAIILYTGYGDRAQLAAAFDIGVRGFVLKEAPIEDLVRAVTTVVAGGTYLDPVLAGALAIGAADKTPSLSPREREVLRLLADGLTNEEIGKRLFLSPETVRTHIGKAMDKLGADTRTQAVALALRQSLIS